MRALTVTLAVPAGILAMLLLTPAARAQQQQTAALAGQWTLNPDLSDAPPDAAGRGDNEPARGRFGRGGGRRGGFGGGFRGGRGDGRNGGADGREAMTRRREAMREILEAPDRLTITESDAMVIVTTGEGRTIRLSPDGKKVKDESTGIERKAHWEDGKLVDEITGAGPGKIVETYAVDPERHQLTVTLQVENSRMPNAGPHRRVYDAS
jgi:hypothetical protein